MCVCVVMLGEGQAVQCPGLPGVPAGHPGWEGSLSSASLQMGSRGSKLIKRSFWAHGAMGQGLGASWGAGHPAASRALTVPCSPPQGAERVSVWLPPLATKPPGFYPGGSTLMTTSHRLPRAPPLNTTLLMP